MQLYTELTAYSWQKADTIGNCILRLINICTCISLWKGIKMESESWYVSKPKRAIAKQTNKQKNKQESLQLRLNFPTEMGFLNLLVHQIKTIETKTKDYLYYVCRPVWA
jgi:hypothetical protein